MVIAVHGWCVGVAPATIGPVTDAGRPPSTEERFLAELRELRRDPSVAPAEPMLARFRRQRDSGGPGGTDFEAGKLIPVTEAVRVFLWPVDAEPSAKPTLVAHMRCEPGDGWARLDEPADVVVRGRREKGAALVVEADGCRFESLHPASTRWWRSPRLRS